MEEQVYKRRFGQGMQYEDRNKGLVWLRKLDRKHYTFEVLGRIFDVNRRRAKQIYDDYSDKYPLPDWVERR